MHQLLAAVGLVALTQFVSFTETAAYHEGTGRTYSQTKQITIPVPKISNYGGAGHFAAKLHARYTRDLAPENYDSGDYGEEEENVHDNNAEPLITENDTATEYLMYRTNPSVSTEYIKDLLAIRKCCSRAEEFSHNSTECVPRLGTEDDTEEEILYPPMDENVSYWVPPSLRSRTLKVTYSKAGKYFEYSATVKADEDTIHRFLKIDNRRQLYELEGFKELGNNLFVTKQIYCFERQQKSFHSFVIYTSINVATINKCCKKGQQLDSQVSHCTPRSGHQVEDIGEELINFNHNNHNSYWAPISSGERKLLVKYYTSRDYYFKRTPIVIKVDSSSNISYTDDGTLIFTPKLFLPTKDINLLHPSYCVDAVESGVFAPHVLVALPCYYYGCVAKCCLPGQMLSRNGYCESSTDIIQDNSSIATATDSDNSDYLVSFLPATCLNNFFETEDFPDFSDKALLTLTGNYGFLIRPKLRLGCVDWQHTATGTRKVYGTCTIPPNVELYERTRPVGAATAAVLAAAAVAAVARSDTRRTAHGRALACHALCLCASNALQVAWFFKPKAFGETYPTYFFMVAANFWLFSITLNMFRGFKQPLGPLSAQRPGIVWKRFALLSGVAWGGAAVLTTLSIAMHADYFERKSLSYVTPSFAETRQCYIEQPLAAEDDYIPLNSLLYYFAPMVLLVTMNIIFIVSITVKMRRLKRDASFLHADRKGTRPSSFKRALVYVRLLLLAGVVELSLELVAWTTRSHRQYHVFESIYPLALENYYNYVIAVTLVDAVRALGVLWMCVGPAVRRWRVSCWETLQRLGRQMGRRLARVAPQATSSSSDLQTQSTHL